MNNFDLNTVTSDRRRRYREMLDFYHGRQWTGLRREEKRLTFNYAAAVVDKLTAYLMNGLSVRAVALDASAEAKARAARAQNLLDKVARDNNLFSLSKSFPSGWSARLDDSGVVAQQGPGEFFPYVTPNGAGGGPIPGDEKWKFIAMKTGQTTIIMTFSSKNPQPNEPSITVNLIVNVK